MGWVSTSEDIDELRAEHEHYMRAIDNLIDGISSAKSVPDLQGAESSLLALSARLIDVYKSKKTHAEELLAQAIEVLRDPAQRLSAKIEKRDRQLKETRKERDKALAELTSARESRDKLSLRLRELERENAALRKSLQGAEERLTFADAMRGVRPL